LTVIAPIVTGRGEAHHWSVLHRGARHHVRRSTALIRAPKALITLAPKMVLEFSYRDRLEGKPLYDEQGSYDRSPMLSVTFDTAKLDAALAHLGRRLSPRDRCLSPLRIDIGISGY
jgi:uncharacterized protein